MNIVKLVPSKKSRTVCYFHQLFIHHHLLTMDTKYTHSFNYNLTVDLQSPYIQISSKCGLGNPWFYNVTTTAR